MRTNLAAVVTALALTGCLTQFTGASRVLNGPRGCWDQCQAWGMDLAGMVKMGEYSDGCICQVRPPPPPAPAPHGAPSSDSRAPGGAESGPAVAGVWLQMQAIAASAAQQSSVNRQPGYSPFSPFPGAGHFGPGHLGPR